MPASDIAPQTTRAIFQFNKVGVRQTTAWRKRLRDFDLQLTNTMSYEAKISPVRSYWHDKKIFQISARSAKPFGRSSADIQTHRHTHTQTDKLFQSLRVRGFAIAQPKNWTCCYWKYKVVEWENISQYYEKNTESAIHNKPGTVTSHNGKLQVIKKSKRFVREKTRSTFFIMLLYTESFNFYPWWQVHQWCPPRLICTNYKLSILDHSEQEMDKMQFITDESTWKVSKEEDALGKDVVYHAHWPNYFCEKKGYVQKTMRKEWEGRW